VSRYNTRQKYFFFQKLTLPSAISGHSAKHPHRVTHTHTPYPHTHTRTHTSTHTHPHTHRVTPPPPHSPRRRRTSHAGPADRARALPPPQLVTPAGRIHPALLAPTPVCLDGKEKQKKILLMQGLPSVITRTLDKLEKVCRVSGLWHSANLVTLPSVSHLTLGKSVHFAECRTPDTRQTWPFCRVSPTWHSANLATLPSVFNRHSAKWTLTASSSVTATLLCRVSTRYSENSLPSAR